MFLMAIVLSLMAQVSPAPPLARVEAVPVKSAVNPGAPVTLEIAVTPREGIHVYAPPQKQYIPISVAVEASKGARVGKPQFPPSAVRTFEGEKVRVYDKPFSIRIPVVISSREPVSVAGVVTYQACDDVMCYRPIKVPVRWDVRLQ